MGTCIKSSYPFRLYDTLITPSIQCEIVYTRKNVCQMLSNCGLRMGMRERSK